MYSGIVELGPFDASLFAAGHFVAGKFFAHRFYYLDGMVYLFIDNPHNYYTVFRKNVVRIDNKNNLCR